METEKSYVGLQLCFICRKESTAVLLDRRLKSTLTNHEIGLDVCDKCKEKYLKEGVLLMEAQIENNKKIPTGNFAVLRDKAFKKMFNMEIPLKKICMVEAGLLEKIGVK